MSSPGDIVNAVCEYVSAECEKAGRRVSPDDAAAGLYLVRDATLIEWAAELRLKAAGDEVSNGTRGALPVKPGQSMKYRLHSPSPGDPPLSIRHDFRLFDKSFGLPDSCRCDVAFSDPRLDEGFLGRALAKMAEKGCIFTFYTARPDTPTLEEIKAIDAENRRIVKEFSKRVSETAKRYGKSSSEFAALRKEGFGLMGEINASHDAEYPIKHNVNVIPKAGSLEELELKLSLA